MPFSRESKFALNQNRIISRDAPPAHSEGVNGDQALVKFGGKPPRMYIKSNNVWYYTELKQAATSSEFAKNRFTEDLLLEDGMTMTPDMNAKTRSTIQYGTKSIVSRSWMNTCTVNKVNGNDNSVIKQIGTSPTAGKTFFFPEHTVIFRTIVKVLTLTNLGTTECSVQVSETSGTGADSAISSGKELLGAGASGTASTDSASASNISVGTTGPDLGDMWANTEAIPLSASRTYPYLCNALGNGGTDPTTEGVLVIFFEYITFDNFTTTSPPPGPVE